MAICSGRPALWYVCVCVCDSFPSDRAGCAGHCHTFWWCFIHHWGAANSFSKSQSWDMLLSLGSFHEKQDHLWKWLALLTALTSDSLSVLPPWNPGSKRDSTISHLLALGRGPTALEEPEFLGISWPGSLESGWPEPCKKACGHFASLMLSSM